MPAQLDRNSYFVGRGSVLVRSSDLVNTLINDTAKAVTQLSGVSPITLNKISIDETGNVIITDDGFRDKIKAALDAPGGASTNIAGCGNITCGGIE
jgi:hypothetical protein